MAAEDREKLRGLLLPAAAALLAPRSFDLILDENGIGLKLDGKTTSIATAAEIADGTFKAAFSRRIREAAGIEDREPEGESRPAPLPPKAKVSQRPVITRTSTPAPSLQLSRLPAPKWVAEAAEMTGAVAAPIPEIEPICVPTMRLTRRAQTILAEIEERHRE
jgi:hypothetical protein